jgi:hypothetical protein
VRVQRKELAFWVAVRRAGVGAKPFRWEIHGAETAEPVQLSDEKFPTMDLAYQAGQSNLQVFLQTRN